MSEQPIESQETEVQDDQLASLPADRLAAMLRDKRKSEATYRTKLRDVEAERDSLVGTVAGFQQEALKAAASKAGVLPTALGDLGLHVPLESVLGDGGLLDSEKAETALAELRVSKPHFFPAMAPTSGHGGGFTGEGHTSAAASWSDVLS